MSKPKEVNVSLYDNKRGEIHVWNVSFKLKGSAPKPEDVSKLQKEIKSLVEKMSFSNE